MLLFNFIKVQTIQLKEQKNWLPFKLKNKAVMLQDNQTNTTINKDYIFTASLSA